MAIFHHIKHNIFNIKQQGSQCSECHLFPQVCTLTFFAMTPIQEFVVKLRYSDIVLYRSLQPLVDIPKAYSTFLS